jgi:hypothetical protein
MAKWEEADPALASENLRLVAGILMFQQAKDRVKAREVNLNQGIVQVETRILMGVVAIC